MLKSAFTLLFFAVTAAAQTAPTHADTHVETTISLGAAAQLTATRVQIDQFNSFNTQALDPSAAVLGTIRQSFKPWLGYTANFGFTRTTEVNTGPTIAEDASHYLAIPSNVYETSVAWHLQNHITPRLTGFVDAGAGALTFLPHHVYPTGFAPAVTFRPLGLASIGIDYRLTPHLALRAEYRGLIYKYPDFGGYVPRSVTLTSQPTISLVYQFDRKH
jgi:hypothetical protein